MYSQGISSPSYSGRSPKLLQNSFRTGIAASHSSANRSGFSPGSPNFSAKFTDPAVEMERMERELSKISQVCQQEGTDSDQTI